MKCPHCNGTVMRPEALDPETSNVRQKTLRLLPGGKAEAICKDCGRPVDVTERLRRHFLAAPLRAKEA